MLVEIRNSSVAYAVGRKIITVPYGGGCGGLTCSTLRMGQKICIRILFRSARIAFNLTSPQCLAPLAQHVR